MAFWNRSTDTTMHSIASDSRTAVAPAHARPSSLEAGPFRSFGALRRFERELAQQPTVHEVRLVRVERGYARFTVLASGGITLPETATQTEHAGQPAFRPTAASPAHLYAA